MPRHNSLPRIAGMLACAAGAAATALAATPARAAGAVTVDNPLQACMAVQLGTRTIDRGVLLQALTLDTRKPVGACGCKSAIVGYTARVLLDGGARGLLLQGRLNTRADATTEAATGATPRTLPLAADATLAGDRPVTLSFECAAPD